MTKKLLWILAITVVLIALIAGGIALWFVMHKDDLPKGIAMGNGRIEAQEIDIATRSGGRVQENLVEEGDLVTAGQIIVRMDLKDLSATREGSKAKVRQAINKQAEATADLEQCNANLDLATKEAQRAEILVGPGVISRSSNDKAINQKLSAEAAVAAAKQRLEMTLEATTTAQSEVDRLNELLMDEELKATRDGRVLYKLASTGEILGAGGRAATLLDFTDIYMSIYLSTEQTGLLNLGDDAVIILDALPDNRIPALISYISPEAQFTPRQVETKTERDRLMFRVKIKISAALLQKYMTQVRTGLPGVAYVKLDKNTAWPDKMRPDPALVAQLHETDKRP